MATGIEVTQANGILDALCRSVAYADPAAFFLKLHTGDPGAAGANNAAVETTRKAVTFSAAALGAITNSVAVTWVAVAASETYSFWSAWDTVGPAGGNFLCSDDFSVAQPVTAGNTFTIAIGDLDINITVIAA